MSEPTPLDRELRDRIRRYLPEEATPASGLTSALGRGRKLRRRRQIVAVVGVAVATAAVPVAAVVTARGLDDGTRQVQPAEVTRLLGTFSHEVRAPAAVRGRWSLTFRGDDSITVNAPAGYRGVLSGVAYSASGGTLRINLFIQDRCAGQAVGRYHWSRDV